MPHSTVRYLFECRVHAWARQLRDGDGFVAIPGEDGSLTVHGGTLAWAGKVLVEHSDKDRLTCDAARWIFYDPFEWPEYAWLEWSNVPRPVLERLLGSPFVPADLADPLGTSGMTEIPESWSVMF